MNDRIQVGEMNIAVKRVVNSFNNKIFFSPISTFTEIPVQIFCRFSVSEIAVTKLGLYPILELVSRHLHPRCVQVSAFHVQAFSGCK